MAARVASAAFIVDRIKATLVGLRMPRALEIVDVIVRQLERDEATALEAIDSLLAEELTLRENRRVKTVLAMVRLSTLKTLSGRHGIQLDEFDARQPGVPVPRSSVELRRPGIRGVQALIHPLIFCQALSKC